MAGRKAKSGKGKSRKGRGRKTTDWLSNNVSALIGAQTSSSTSTGTSKRFQSLSVTGGNGSETFKLSLENETIEVDHNATAKEVERKIRKGFTTVTSVVCTGDRLGASPVEIDFKKTTFASVPMMSSDPAGLGQGGTAPVTEVVSNEKEWTWTELANWKDANSGRAIMDISANMKFFADATGLWRLGYKRKLYAFDHTFVYKLKAYSVNDELLFRLTIPASGGVNVMMPSDKELDVVAEGMSVALADLLPEVHLWVRCGVGEYWD